MIPVDRALALCLDQVAPLDIETVPLIAAAGRVLREALAPARPQPPFDASAMDGYAIRAADGAPGTVLRVVGTAAAGAAWTGSLQPGEAARIFTGAPVPTGATRVVLQEDVTRTGDTITLGAVGTAAHIRPQGADFGPDFRLAAPRRLGPADCALIAAMGHPGLRATRRPEVAILSTGDELVMPGEVARDDQIVASNLFALSAMLTDAGATPRILPIAADTQAALHQAFDLAAGADLVVTIGGASVGEHDLVAGVAADRGATLAFHKVAMRPGKPLMAGRIGQAAFLGLPGNPVSAFVCAHLFLLPMVRRMLGLAHPAPRPSLVRLAVAVGANGPRAHYMRARFDEGRDGRAVTPFDQQDSAFLSILSEANCLLIRPPHDPAQPAGALVEILPLAGPAIHSD